VNRLRPTINHQPPNQQQQPQGKETMKVSRVVLIVVALHVLVIGGIFVFEGCSRARTSGPDIAADDPLPADATDHMAAAGLPGGTAPMLPPDLSPAVPAPPPVAPAAAPTSRIYVVQKGDSLWKIARAEGVNMSELARINNLTKNSILQIGQKLEIPAPTQQQPVTTATASIMPSGAPAGLPGDAATTSPDLYTVQSGDSLWKLARQHNVSVAAIKQANNLTSDMLRIGQKLRIPASAAGSDSASAAPSSYGGGWNYNDYREPGVYTEGGVKVHYVNHGESPAIIAQRHGIGTAELLRANNITDPRKIQYGQRLIIPQAGPGPTSATGGTATPVVTATTEAMP
jgi:peptidoglycan endopeptidase LytF